MLRKIFFEYNKPSMLLYTYKKQKKKINDECTKRQVAKHKTIG